MALQKILVKYIMEKTLALCYISIYIKDDNVFFSAPNTQCEIRLLKHRKTSIHLPFVDVIN